MDNPQPGQTFLPEDNNNQASASTQEQGAPSPEANLANTQDQVKPKTADEIAAIDTAMEVHQSNETPNNQEPQAIQSAPHSSPDDQPDQLEVVDNPGVTPAGMQQMSNQVSDQSMDGANGDLLIAWRASDASSGEFNSRALIGLLLLGSVVIALLIWLGGLDFGTISAIVVVVLGIIAFIVANKSHNDYLEEYSLDAQGVNIADKRYLYTELRAFSLVGYEDSPVVELLPTKRFLPRLSLNLDPATSDRVIETLAMYLPHEDRQSDFIDNINRRFKL